MAAVTREDLEQFRVRFGELARVRRGEIVQVDPFLVAQAIALVMRECSVRSAAGRPLVWNQYRMILARRDFEMIRPLQGPLERDLRDVLAKEAQTRKAELVGELRVTVVFDEANELMAGEAVVRVAFMPTEQLAAPRPGEMTMRLDSYAVAGEIAARAPSGGTDTVMVHDAVGAAVVMQWAGGQAPLVAGSTVIIGRPHADPPAHFVSLVGASPKVNKQHAWLLVTESGVRVGRFAKANPVAVSGVAIAAGEEAAVALPAEISLSHGELVVVVRRA